MLVDKFVILFQADSGKASADTDAMARKGEAAANKISEAVNKALKKLGASAQAQVKMVSDVDKALEKAALAEQGRIEKQKNADQALANQKRKNEESIEDLKRRHALADAQRDKEEAARAKRKKEDAATEAKKRADRNRTRANQYRRADRLTAAARKHQFQLLEAKAQQADAKEQHKNARAAAVEEGKQKRFDIGHALKIRQQEARESAMAARAEEKERKKQENERKRQESENAKREREASGTAGRNVLGERYPMLAQLMRLGPVMGALVVASMALAATIRGVRASIDIANDRAQDSLNKPAEAYAAGRNLLDYSGLRASAREIGMNDDEVAKSAADMAGKAIKALVEPWGEERMRFREAGIGVGTLSSARDPKDIMAAVIKAMREMKTPAEGIAWATNRMGMSFTMAERIMRATDEQIQAFIGGNKKLEGQMILQQLISRDLAEAQRKVSQEASNAADRMAIRVSPALQAFNEKLADLIKQSGPFVDAMAKITNAITNFGTKAIEVATDIMNWDKGGKGKIATRASTALQGVAPTTSKALGFLGAMWTLDYKRSQQEYQHPPTVGKISDTPAPAGKFAGATLPEQTPPATPAPATKEKAPESVKSILAGIKNFTQEQTDKLNSEINSDLFRALSEGDQVKYLKQLVEMTRTSGKTLGDIAKYSVPPIPIKPATVGFEQALSLWAAGIGAARGIATPKGQAGAGTRLTMEDFNIDKMSKQRSVEYHGQVPASAAETYAAVGGNLDIKKIDLTRNNDVIAQKLRPMLEKQRAYAEEFAGPTSKLHQLLYGTRRVNFDQINAAGMPAGSGGVTINQTNEYNMHFPGGASRSTDIEGAVRRSAAQSTRNAVNALSNDVSR